MLGAHRGDLGVQVVDLVANRGDVARLFGELITLIEADKRHAGVSRTLPYSQKDLWVPANLHLLGTMNSFDVVQATTAGGPARTTEVLNIFIYRTFGQGLFAQATTMSLVLVLVISIIAFPTIILLRRRERVL